MNYQYGSEENLRKILNSLAIDDVEINIYLRARTSVEFDDALKKNCVPLDSGDTQENFTLIGDLESRLVSLVEQSMTFKTLCDKEKVLPGLMLTCNPSGFDEHRISKLAALADPIVIGILRTPNLPIESYKFARKFKELDKQLNSHYLLLTGYRPISLKLTNENYGDTPISEVTVSAKQVMNDEIDRYELKGCSFTVSPRTETVDHYSSRSSHKGSFYTHGNYLVYNGPMSDQEVKSMLDEVISGNFQTKLEKMS